MLTLRQWRRARNITQGQMAEKLGVHISTYQNWEKEPEKISVSAAATIMSILNVAPNDIRFEREPEQEVTE